MIALTDQLLRRDGVVIGISSDAAVQHYETWGAYGASKAALDHLVLTHRRGDRPHDVRRGPGRHAHPDAPGRLPG